MLAPEFSSIEPAEPDEVIVAATSSRLLTDRLTDCPSLTLPAASVTTTVKLYSSSASKLGSSLKVTAPVCASIERASSLPAARLKVKPPLISAESSAVAV